MSLKIKNHSILSNLASGLTFETPSDTVAEGWLRAQYGGSKVWKRRYFKLYHSKSLEYFKSIKEASSVAEGSISISSVDMKPVFDGNKPMWSLTPKTGNVAPMILLADDRNSMQKWMNSITAVMANLTEALLSQEFYDEGDPVGDWQTVKSDNGQSYYWNTKTNVTQWEKPSELSTPVSPVISSGSGSVRSKSINLFGLKRSDSQSNSSASPSTSRRGGGGGETPSTITSPSAATQKTAQLLSPRSSPPTTSGQTSDAQSSSNDASKVTTATTSNSNNTLSPEEKRKQELADRRKTRSMPPVTPMSILGETYDPNHFRTLHFEGKKLEFAEIPGQTIFGIIAFRDGGSYKGQLKGNSPNGLGILIDNMKNSYFGQFQNNNKDGLGVYQWADGDQYSGKFELGQETGCGVWHGAEGGSYEGAYLGGNWHGFGLHTKTNGKIDFGEFVEGQLKTTKGVDKDSDAKLPSEVQKSIDEANATRIQALAKMEEAIKFGNYVTQWLEEAKLKQKKIEGEKERSRAMNALKAAAPLPYYSAKVAKTITGLDTNLTVKEGMIITILNQNADGRWLAELPAENGGTIGFIPQHAVTGLVPITSGFGSGNTNNSNSTHGNAGGVVTEAEITNTVVNHVILIKAAVAAVIKFIQANAADNGDASVNEDIINLSKSAVMGISTLNSKGSQSPMAKNDVLGAAKDVVVAVLSLVNICKTKTALTEAQQNSIETLSSDVATKIQALIAYVKGL